jgi:hypothetical protein
MFYDLATKLQYLKEAKLPLPQQELLDKFGPAKESDYEKYSTYGLEDNLVKFWMLSDGTLVHVPYAHYCYGWSYKELRSAECFTFRSDHICANMMELGAYPVSVNNEILVVEVQDFKELANKQKETLLKLYDRYGFSKIVTEVNNLPFDSRDKLTWLLSSSKRELELIKANEVIMNNLLDKLFEIGFAGLQRKQKTITKLFPSFPDRVKKIASMGGLRLLKTDEEKWTFKVHSGTQDGVWYDVYILFKNIPATLERLVMDRRLWVADRSKVDMSKLAREFLNTADVQTSCSCPADLYYGGHYIRSLGKYDAKYSDKELRSPRIKNPRQYGAYCKHLENVMRVLPFYATTASRWLADFYGDEMSEHEEKAKAQFGWIKKAAVALGAKKEEEEQEVKI